MCGYPVCQMFCTLLAMARIPCLMRSSYNPSLCIFMCIALFECCSFYYCYGTCSARSHGFRTRRLGFCVLGIGFETREIASCMILLLLSGYRIKPISRCKLTIRSRRMLFQVLLVATNQCMCYFPSGDCPPLVLECDLLDVKLLCTS